MATYGMAYVGFRRGSVRAWCTLVFASAWRYVTQLPQGRNAARVSGLFRVRGGFLISSCHSCIP